MPLIHFPHPLVLETFNRILSAKSLLELLDSNIPKAEWEEREALRTLAKEENWDESDYFIEGQVLDSKYPAIARLGAYSIVILLYSIVETQLLALADEIGKKKKSDFSVNDISGRGIEKAQTYLKRVATLDLTTDPGWSSLRELQSMRNVIVHSMGTPKQNPKTIDHLVGKYQGLLDAPVDQWGRRQEIVIRMPLCRKWCEQIEEFFKRTFKAVGLSKSV